MTALDLRPSWNADVDGGPIPYLPLHSGPTHCFSKRVLAAIAFSWHCAGFKSAPTSFRSPCAYPPLSPHTGVAFGAMRVRLSMSQLTIRGHAWGHALRISRV